MKGSGVKTVKVRGEQLCKKSKRRCRLHTPPLSGRLTLEASVLTYPQGKQVHTIEMIRPGHCLGRGEKRDARSRQDGLLIICCWVPNSLELYDRFQITPMLKQC